MSITVGQRASRSLTLTAEHVRKFAEISGDHNPLHSTRLSHVECRVGAVRRRRGRARLRPTSDPELAEIVRPSDTTTPRRRHINRISWRC
jgi:hypothetical protein